MNKKRIIAIAIVVLVLAASLFTLVACDDTPVVETRFAVDLDNTSVWGFPGIMLGGIIDKEASGVVLRSDGTMTLDLILSKNVFNTLLSLDIVTDMLAGLDIASFQTTYLDPIMPGFSFDDIEGSLDQAYEALGVRFVSNGDTNAFLETLVGIIMSGELPESLEAPEGFGLRVESTYYVKDVVYPDGTVYKGVYLTPTDADTQPYVVFDLSENDDGGHTLNLKVDFIKLNLTLNEVLPEAEEEAA